MPNKYNYDSAIEYLQSDAFNLRSSLIEMMSLLYDLLIKCEESHQVLKYCFEHYDNFNNAVETEESNTTENDKSYQILRLKCGTLADGILQKLILENNSEEIFYKKLWYFIYNSPVFDNEEEKIFALYYIFIDDKIPYFHLKEKAIIPKEEFEITSVDLKSHIKKARFITLIPMTKIERSQQLTSLLAEAVTEQEKAVLLLYIIDFTKDIDA